LACTIEDAPEIAVTQEVMMQVCCLAIHPYDELSSKGPFWSHTGTSTVHEWTFRRLGIFSFKDNMLDPASSSSTLSLILSNGNGICRVNIRVSFLSRMLLAEFSSHYKSTFILPNAQGIHFNENVTKELFIRRWI
jgi:hypothetical protein